MDALTITQNDDGTLTLDAGPADPALCPDALYAELEASEHVTIQTVPPVDQWQTEKTYVSITCTNMWLQYLVKTHTDAGYVLELTGYSEQ